MVSPGQNGKRLGALIHFDAGQRAGLLDELDERCAVFALLPDGFVVEDDAGDGGHGLLERNSSSR